MIASLSNQPIYTAQAIYEWEQAWFEMGNSPFGLMAQAGWGLALEMVRILQNLDTLPKILVWCGVGNNGGDGYLVAYHLAMMGYEVAVFAPNLPKSDNAKRAYEQASAKVPIFDAWQAQFAGVNVHIDALFGIGIKGELDKADQALIEHFNTQNGLKIALDIPSGLLADTATPAPVAVCADWTLTVIGLKFALVMGQGKACAGKVVLVPLLPPDPNIASVARVGMLPWFSKRPPHAHKGDFGFVAVIGGGATMGGAVLLAGLSAMAVGAGRASVACHSSHFGAVLAHNPSLMTADSAMGTDEWEKFLADKTVVCLGMGLGRDDGARQIFETVVKLCKKQNKCLILDADGLYHFAHSKFTLNDDWVATPHSAEAGRLLGVEYGQIDKDKVSAIKALQARYGGQWVLKGAGTLTLDNQGVLSVCPFGNAGMATAGMGDVLAGVVTGLVAQKDVQATLADCVAVHALAGDRLARQGERGLSAFAMMNELTMVVQSASSSFQIPPNKSFTLSYVCGQENRYASTSSP